MTRRIVFLDCETTSLDPAVRQAWEVALIVREHGDKNQPIPERDRHWFVDATWLDMDKADRDSLAIGGFDERYDREWAFHPATVLDEVFEELRDATVVGSNPHFDLSTLAAMSRRFFPEETEWDGHEPWHYRAVDVTSMAMPVLGLTHPVGLAETAERLGIDLVMSGRRLHTAAGDARVAADVYDVVRFWADNTIGAALQQGREEAAS